MIEKSLITMGMKSKEKNKALTISTKDRRHHTAATQRHQPLAKGVLEAPTSQATLKPPNQLLKGVLTPKASAEQSRTNLQ